MTTAQQKQAIVIGASSGIGQALTRKLVEGGWRVIAAARRMDLLQKLAEECGETVSPCQMDVSDAESAQGILESVWQTCAQVDLVLVSAGTGHINGELAWEPERETLDVNVLGFAAVSGAAMRLFVQQGFGHLAGITSVARFLGDGEAPAYGASKAFVSLYLDGLRALAKQKKLPIYVTELCPGFVDTAMMKADKPFWVVTPEKAAEQMLHALRTRQKRAYISRRWALVAWLLRAMPRW